MAPMTTACNQPLIRTFVELADTLIEDYDLGDFLHRLVTHCTDLFGGAAAGLMLVNQRGGVDLIASSTEQSELVELFQLQSATGPCLEAISAGAAVGSPDLVADSGRWSPWSEYAIDAGFRAAYATPMRLRSTTIGALNLFGTELAFLDTDDLAVVQALADIATIGILQERAIRRGEILSEQLQVALNSRVLIEQAKGVVAGRSDLGLSMDRAFLLLRDHSRRTNTKLGVVCQAIVDGTLDPAELVAKAAGGPRPPLHS
jgi:transcriptional regulator with GAF, ATPase, and Fis domain